MYKYHDRTWYRGSTSNLQLEIKMCHLPQPVFFPKRLRSYEVLTMQHNEHVGDEQS